MSEFRIWSDDFLENSFCAKSQEFDDAAFGTNGQNVSPTLYWEGVPSEAKSLALTVYDPDAPTGSGFWHWVAVNIPVRTTSLALDAGSEAGDLLPAGAIQFRNDYGRLGFGGFAPPKGDKAHRYIFRIHALKVEALPLHADVTNAIARFMLHMNELASASITGLYAIP